jgi:hypothetical protein
MIATRLPMSVREARMPFWGWGLDGIKPRVHYGAAAAWCPIAKRKFDTVSRRNVAAGQLLE